VGPVHAGVIEPGHFRLSVVGETIIDMKSRLLLHPQGHGEALRGPDTAEGVVLARAPSRRTRRSAARARLLPGLEALASAEIPARARYLRVVLLEMERLYNHIADFWHDRRMIPGRGRPLALLRSASGCAVNKRLTGNPAASRERSSQGALVRDVSGQTRSGERTGGDPWPTSTRSSEDHSEQHAGG